MSDYEARQEARRERLRERAEKAETESQRRYKAFRQEADMIPLGQPVLVGHHSERGHRAALRRMDNNVRKSIEAEAKAKRLRERAESVGKGGVSSDDPEAVDKLRERLAGLERQHKEDKEVNRLYRKGGAKALAEAGFISPESVEAFEGKMASAYSWERQPVPKYVISNRNANIRRIRERVAQLEAMDSEPEREPESGTLPDGIEWEVSENRAINRVCVAFSERPDRDVTQAMRRAGFRWNRTQGAWTRHISTQAWYRATTELRSLSNPQETA